MRRIELLDLVTAGGTADRSREDVLRELTAISSGAGAATNVSMTSDTTPQNSTDLKAQLSELTRNLTDVNSSQQALAAAMQDNTQAVTRNTTVKGSGGSSVASNAGNFASSFFGGGLALSPIISGIMSLFRGSSQPAVAPLTPFKLPAPVQYQAGLTSASAGSIVPVDYGQSGQVRTSTANPAPQVQIQVNAMDSRSFLDHSEEIANAVKTAILNSHSINDVISDL